MDDKINGRHQCGRHANKPPTVDCTRVIKIQVFNQRKKKKKKKRDESHLAVDGIDSFPFHRCRRSRADGRITEIHKNKAAGWCSSYSKRKRKERAGDIDCGRQISKMAGSVTRSFFSDC